VFQGKLKKSRADTRRETKKPVKVRGAKMWGNPRKFAGKKKKKETKSKERVAGVSSPQQKKKRRKSLNSLDGWGGFAKNHHTLQKSHGKPQKKKDAQLGPKHSGDSDEGQVANPPDQESASQGSRGTGRGQTSEAVD